MKNLRFAVFGCGFWARFQIGAWSEIPGVELVALYNRTLSKAKALAEQFNVPRIYNDPGELLKNEKLDFVEIFTDVDIHARFTELAVKHGVRNVICQKPMAPSFEEANRMINMCRNAGVNFYIHENYRWQAPIRRFREIMDSGIIGKPFKARVSFLSGFPVFDNQPFLAELDKFIITDMGSHILDVTRYLFGEANTLWCQTRSVNPGIRGEDLAVVMMEMINGMPVYSETVRFPSYPWADPDYIVNHESGIPICCNILADMLGKGKAENTGTDNFETVKLVWASYESAATGKMIRMDSFGH
jgi:predicted dehydrogenase